MLPQHCALRFEPGVMEGAAKYVMRRHSLASGVADIYVVAQGVAGNGVISKELYRKARRFPTTHPEWQRLCAGADQARRDAMRWLGVFEKLMRKRMKDCPMMWNPYNKVVQDYRTSKVDLERTNAARKERHLPVPWTPELAKTEVRQPPVF
jgi:hypothetical protein